MPLTNGSLLIGRAPTCHVVLSDPHVSRRHVLVLEVDGAAQVVPLGKGQIELGGRPLEEPAMVRDGDVLRIAGAAFTFEIPADPSEPMYILEVGQHRYPVRRQGFCIGDDEAADLRLPGWPEGAAVLFPVVGALLAELRPEVRVKGGRVEQGLTYLAGGSRLECAGMAVAVLVAKAAADTIDINPAPSHAALEMMPNGALLHVTIERAFLVWLPQKRGDLVAALLSPPAGLRAGEWVPDDQLLPRVWGSESASKAQLNTLIHRTRLSLTSAGLNGPALVERAPGGGATRLRLAKNAAVSVG